ncbi:MAG: hypothetical protein LUE93_15145 [Bacteroides sp.]|nr:hypothetical protein [Bacteroides sp.]
MARRNRQTLKKSFRKGEKPTEKDFENLIDSTLNILDDGFSRSAEAGLELAPLLGEKRVVLSVYREPGDAQPQWELSVGGAGELKISKAGIADSSPLLVLNPDGSVVLGERESKITLAGVMETPGRSGIFFPGAYRLMESGTI